MAKVLKKIRLVNPGKKRLRTKKRIRNSKRKLSAKQIKYFGTPAQKAALRRKRSRKNPLKYKGKLAKFKKAAASATKDTKKLYVYKLENPARKKRRVVRKRRSTQKLANIGEIITVGLNPGKKRRVSSMARRKRSKARRVTRRRRIGNPFFGLMRRKRRSSGRRRNPRRIRRVRRSNPGLGQVKVTGVKVLSLLGGAAVTKLISDRVPAQFATGPIGYVVTAVVATIQGMLAGKMLRKPEVGSSMMLGGYTYLGLKILAENFPGFAGYVPFGLSGGRGVGLLAPSSFYTPQVPQSSSVSSFVAPSAVTSIASQAGMRGIRTGRRA